MLKVLTNLFIYYKIFINYYRIIINVKHHVDDITSNIYYDSVMVAVLQITVRTRIYYLKYERRTADLVT